MDGLTSLAVSMVQRDVIASLCFFFLFLTQLMIILGFRIIVKKTPNENPTESLWSLVSYWWNFGSSAYLALLLLTLSLFVFYLTWFFDDLSFLVRIVKLS